MDSGRVNPVQVNRFRQPPPRRDLGARDKLRAGGVQIILGGDPDPPVDQLRCVGKALGSSGVR